MKRTEDEPSRPIAIVLAEPTEKGADIVNQIAKEGGQNISVVAATQAARLTGIIPDIKDECEEIDLALIDMSIPGSMTTVLAAVRAGVARILVHGEIHGELPANVEHIVDELTPDVIRERVLVHLESAQVNN